MTIEKKANDRLTEMAAMLKSNRSELTQWLIENVELDSSGKPARWQGRSADDQTELPVTS